jgi:hypothetical protein
MFTAACGESAYAAVEAYATRFLLPEHPTTNVFLRLVNRARNTGNLLL